MQKLLRGAPDPALAPALALAFLTFLGCHGPGQKQPAGAPPAADESLSPAPANPLPVAPLDPGSADAEAVTAPTLPPPPPPLLRVLDYGPKGPTDGGASIYVRFNQPVASLEKTGDHPADYCFHIEPALPGRCRFQTPERLVFDFEETPRTAQSYKVSLPGPIVAASGARYEAPLEFQFETPRPQVARYFPEADAPERPRTEPAFIALDQKASLSQLSSRLRASARPRDNSAAPWKPIPIRVVLATQKESERHDLPYIAEEIGRQFTIFPQGQQGAGGAPENALSRPPPSVRP